MGIVGGAAEAVGDFFGELLDSFIVHGEEDLVRRGFEVERDAFFGEGLLDFLSVAVGVFADLEIEVIFEKLIELDAQEPPFGEKGAVLLDDGEEMGNQRRIRDHHRFAEEGAAFRAADVEDIREAGKVRERHVILGAAQGIGEASAVHEEGHVMGAAHGRNGGELFQRVEGAPFGGLGNINHPRRYHVVAVVIGIEGFHIIVDGSGAKLAFF